MINLIVFAVFAGSAFLALAAIVTTVAMNRDSSSDIDLGTGGNIIMIGMALLFGGVAYWSGSWLFFSEDEPAPIVSIAPDTSYESRDDVDEMIATMLNIGGHLCAEVVHVQPLRLKDRYEVECIEYRGGRGRVTYILDAQTGHAVKN